MQYQIPSNFDKSIDRKARVDLTGYIYRTVDHKYTESIIII